MLIQILRNDHPLLDHSRILSFLINHRLLHRLLYRLNMYLSSPVRLSLTHLQWQPDTPIPQCLLSVLPIIPNFISFAHLIVRHLLLLRQLVPLGGHYLGNLYHLEVGAGVEELLGFLLVKEVVAGTGTEDL